MPEIDDVARVIAQSVGCSVEHARAMSAALGHAGEASFSTAADLVVAILGASAPQEARHRVALYRRVPLAEAGFFKVNDKGAPDAAPKDFVIDAADLPALFGPGSGARIAPVARSFGDAVEELIRRLAAGEELDLPYLVRAGRHDEFPVAYIASRNSSAMETIMSFRITAHTAEEYVIAAGRLNVSADIGGAVFEALADLFRKDARATATIERPIVSLLVSDGARP